MVEFVQLTTECCWGQPSDPCQRGCLTSHACVMWGPRTLNADDDDDDVYDEQKNYIEKNLENVTQEGDIMKKVSFQLNFKNIRQEFRVKNTIVSRWRSSAQFTQVDLVSKPWLNETFRIQYGVIIHNET